MKTILLKEVKKTYYESYVASRWKITFLVDSKPKTIKVFRSDIESKESLESTILYFINQGLSVRKIKRALDLSGTL